MKKMKKIVVTVIFVVMAVMIFAAGCGSDEEDGRASYTVRGTMLAIGEGGYARSQIAVLPEGATATNAAIIFDLPEGEDIKIPAIGERADFSINGSYRKKVIAIKPIDGEESRLTDDDNGDAE